MTYIKIKNFGPIKEGLNGDDSDYIDIKKVTVFIGNQGSGKSTVAKLISTFTWIEKALVRGDFNKRNLTYSKLKKLCAYQNISNYFKKETFIEYIGIAYSLKCVNEQVEINSLQLNEYSFPKIMYIPAERNFTSAVKNVYELRGLPQTLYTFSNEEKLALDSLKESSVQLPINNTRFEYRKQSKSSWIIGDDYEIELSESSSGFQSFVPMFLVSRHLSTFINQEKDPTIKEISIKERLKLKDEISKIYSNKKFSDEIKNTLIEQLSARIQYSCFINIIEEPEQNLFPTSQWEMLKSLLEFNNLNTANKLILTTHSPFLINYLTIAVKGNTLKDKLKTEKQKVNLKSIVPLNATIFPNELAIYEFDEKTGTINKLESFNGLPSDENMLNEKLSEGNEIYAKLLEIQQSL